LQRYDEGNTPYDVYVKLDIPQKEAEEYQVEYWKLRRMYELEQIYNDNKDSLPLIIRMFQEMKARNISLDQLTRATILVNSLPQLYNEYSAIQKEIEVARADYQQRQEELWNIKNELRLKKISNRMISELRKLFI
jgi:hypothetical protein